MAGYLALVRRVPGLNPAGLAALAADVAVMTGRPVTPWAPLTGTAIFTCESGLHLQGLLTDPRTYEPYPPELVGARRVLCVGAKSGRAAMRQVLAGEGGGAPFISEEQAGRVRARARTLGRGMSKEELAALLEG